MLGMCSCLSFVLIWSGPVFSVRVSFFVLFVRSLLLLTLDAYVNVYILISPTTLTLTLTYMYARTYTSCVCSSPHAISRYIASTYATFKCKQGTSLTLLRLLSQSDKLFRDFVSHVEKRSWELEGLESNVTFGGLLVGPSRRVGAYKAILERFLECSNPNATRRKIQGAIGAIDMAVATIERTVTGDKARNEIVKVQELFADVSTIFVAPSRQLLRTGELVCVHIAKPATRKVRSRRLSTLLGSLRKRTSSASSTGSVGARTRTDSNVSTGSTGSGGFEQTNPLLLRQQKNTQAAGSASPPSPTSPTSPTSSTAASSRLKAKSSSRNSRMRRHHSTKGSSYGGSSQGASNEKSETSPATVLGHVGRVHLVLFSDMLVIARGDADKGDLKILGDGPVVLGEGLAETFECKVDLAAGGGLGEFYLQGWTLAPVVSNGELLDWMSAIRRAHQAAAGEGPKRGVTPRRISRGSPGSMGQRTRPSGMEIRHSSTA